MSREPTRRRVLGVAGVSALGLSAGCIGDSDNGADEPTDDTGESDAADDTDDAAEADGTTDGDDASGADDVDDTDDTDDTDESEGNDEDDTPSIDGGAVVFVYDDGPIEDYEDAFPVHQEFDAPASAGIVTEWIGREDFQDTDWMDVTHLEELEGAGWEIMSHTTAHTALASFELVEDAEPDDVRIYPEQRNHGFHLEYEIEVTDGAETVRRTVVDSGHDDVGGYLEFDEPLGESFRAGETVERYPDDLMHEFLGESKAELEELGFTVDTLLAPYDVVDDRAVDIAREYYDGIVNVRPGSMSNDPDGFDPFATRRGYFIENTSRETVEEALDQIAEEETLGVLGAHTFKEEVTADRIRETLEWVTERDLEVVTFRDAIEATMGAAD